MLIRSFQSIIVEYLLEYYSSVFLLYVNVKFTLQISFMLLQKHAPHAHAQAQAYTATFKILHTYICALCIPKFEHCWMTAWIYSSSCVYIAQWNVTAIYIYLYVCGSVLICVHVRMMYISVYLHTMQTVFSLFSWINKPNTHMWCIIVWILCKHRGTHIEREREWEWVYSLRSEERKKWLCHIWELGCDSNAIVIVFLYRVGLQIPHPMHALCKSTQQKSFLCTQRVWRNEPTKTTNKSWEILRIKFGKRNFPICFSLRSSCHAS